MTAAPPLGGRGGSRPPRSPRGLRALPLNSVRNRLALLFFLITTAAVGFVYLYVVPQLNSSLTAEKLRRLEAVGVEKAQRLSAAMERGTGQTELRRLVRRLAQESNARMTVLGVRPGPSGPEPEFVIADSEFERTAVLPSYLPAATAAAAGRVASGVERVAGQRVGETAIALSTDGEPRWVAVLSSPLGDVDANVDLIRRQILIAGAIAIVAASLAGYLAAGAHSRRLRRLETAAEAVAEGNFAVPIPIDSHDEVGQLAISFDEMQQRLASLDSARKEFIANASHELRTPIFSLGGFVELLEEEDPDPDARREFVRNMREQVDRLGKLATDLLELSKIDAGAIAMRATPVDLGRLVAQVAEEFRPAAERRDSPVTVEATAGALARGDPDRIGQLIRILIDNALTHTPEGTPISMTTTSDRETVTVVVSDEGPGIDARASERVFERFYTGDSHVGTGLGLAIARELALRMNGSLALVSAPGRTTFTLELPAATAGAPA
ncbi:MAG: sensor histidine kinase [Solirubrobacterales bacterium]